MDRVFLPKTTILYGLTLDGNHGQSCFFGDPSFLFMAFFDEIYSRDLLGEVNYYFPPNSPHSKRFRFENSLKIIQYRVMEDIKDVPVKEGILKIPLWKQKSQNAVEISQFDDWLSLISRNEVYRLDQKVSMCDLTSKRNLLYPIDAHKIVSANVFKYYYELLKMDKSTSEIKNEFYKRLFMSQDLQRETFGEEVIIKPDLKPKMRDETVKDDLPEIQDLQRLIAEGEVLKTLYRYAAGNISTYEYVQTDDFYKLIWTRDLPVFYDYEPAFPESYNPSLNYSWNYNRMLDIKTVLAWVQTRKRISNAKTIFEDELESRLVRFSLEEVKDIKEISIIDPCYSLRITMVSKLRDDKLRIIATPDLIEEIKNRFVDFNENWIKIGYIPKTAIKDSNILEFDLSNEDSTKFIEVFLSYIVREKLVTTFKFE